MFNFQLSCSPMRESSPDKGLHQQHWSAASLGILEEGGDLEIGRHCGGRGTRHSGAESSIAGFARRGE